MTDEEFVQKIKKMEEEYGEKGIRKIESKCDKLLKKLKAKIPEKYFQKMKGLREVYMAAGESISEDLFAEGMYAGVKLEKKCKQFEKEKEENDDRSFETECVLKMFAIVRNENIKEIDKQFDKMYQELFTTSSEDTQNILTEYRKTVKMIYENRGCRRWFKGLDLGMYIDRELVNYGEISE